MASNGASSSSVAQAILDSVTRCFNPLNSEESPFSKGCLRPSPGPRDEGPPSRAAAAPTREKSKTRSSSAGSSEGARASPRPRDAGGSKYDADRYLHRKLEIFRTTSEDLAELGVTRAQLREAAQRGGRPAPHRPDKALVYSQSSDEITNLTEAHRRANAARQRQAGGGCGAVPDNVRNPVLHPVEALAKLLRDPLGFLQGHAGRVPYGLCFASPVHSTDGVHGDDPPGDWKRTTEDFAARRAPRLTGGCASPAAALACADVDGVVPDADESSASQGAGEDESEGGEDEETITSASYFDQKYSHIVEENPPFQLFDKDRLAVDELRTDELFKLVKRRGDLGQAAAAAAAPRPHGSPRPQPKGKRASPRSSPRASPSGRRASSSSGTASGRSKQGKPSPRTGGAPKRSPKGLRPRRDEAGVPAGKSSSVSSAGSAEEAAATAQGGGGGRRRSAGPPRRRPPEPDIVHATAAR